MTGPQIATSLRTILLRAEEERDQYRRRVQEIEALVVHVSAVVTFIENRGLSADRQSSSRSSVVGLFSRGEVYARCIKALENANSDLSTRQLAEISMTERGLDASDATQRNSMMQVVITAMTNHAHKNEVFSPRKVGRVKLWRLRSMA